MQSLVDNGSESDSFHPRGLARQPLAAEKDRLTHFTAVGSLHTPILPSARILFGMNDSKRDWRNIFRGAFRSRDERLNPIMIFLMVFLAIVAAWFFIDAVKGSKEESFHIETGPTSKLRAAQPAVFRFEAPPRIG